VADFLRAFFVATVVYAQAFMDTKAVGVSKDTAAAMEASTVFPGFKFSPTDVELISYYLKRKMDGLERSVEVIPDLEIYNFEPWDLPGLSSNSNRLILLCLSSTSNLILLFFRLQEKSLFWVPKI